MNRGARAAGALRTALVIGGLAVAAVIVLKLAVPALEPRLAFFPRRDLVRSPKALGLPFEDFTVRAADGVVLHGWFIPGAARGTQPAAAHRPLTILLFHGNGENIGDGLAIAPPVRQAGWNLLLLDYRGYGRSEGMPSEQGIYADGATALAALRLRDDVDPERIVLWGRSIGTAVAVHLAAAGPVRGVILESPFTSAAELLRASGAWALYALARFGTYRFDSAGKMAGVRVPVLVIHGTDDEVVPFALGRRLHDLVPGRREFLAIEGGGHNDLLLRHGDALWAGAHRFLATLETGTD